MGVKIKGNYKLKTNKTTGDYLVRFFDFDGTVLKEQWVNQGEDATAPPTPSHDYLTFTYWNNDYTNIQKDVDTGAIYDTTDGKTYLFITLKPSIGLSPTLYFYKSSTSKMTIDWGDNSTDTTTTSGNQNKSHTYSDYGSYIITMDNPNGGTFRFSNTTTSSYIFMGNYQFCISKLYMGLYLIFGTYSITNQYSMECISISSTLTTFNGTDNFVLCRSLQHLNMPSGFVTWYQGSNIYNSYNIQNIVINSNIPSIGPNTFYALYNIKKFIFGPNLISIGVNSFGNNYNCKHFIFYSVTPPTLGTAAFYNMNKLAKIYVPDESVDSYKGATGWVVFADYIYPLSEYQS